MSNVNLHTCEKAAPGWQKKSKCEQCQREQDQSNFLSSISEDAPDPFQHFEYRMSERAESGGKDAQS